MAKIEVPKIIKELKLADYAAEFGDAAIDVWANPPRGKLEEYDRLTQASSEAIERLKAQPEESGRRLEEIGTAMMAWMAEMWSQGPVVERHWSVEEIRRLVEDSAETDPRLWMWLTARTIGIIAGHRTNRKN